MNNVIVNYADKLTYEELEKLHKAIKREKKHENKYYIKQRIMGGTLVAISVLISVLLHDITASLLLLPLGIGVIITKDKVVI